MTVLVGALCSDGAVIGADSIATSAAGLSPLIRIRSDDKVVTIGDQVIIASTGSVGLSQRFRAIVENAFARGAFNLSRIECMKMISTAAIQDFNNTGVPRSQQYGLGFGAVLAAPVQNQRELVEFGLLDFQPEIKTEALHFVTMGSGQTLADPFIAFVSRVLWRGVMPDVRTATLGVYWALDHAIKYAPGGIGEPIRIATLRRVNGAWRSVLLQESELQETSQHITIIEERIGEYLFDIHQQDAPASAIPAPPSLGDGQHS